MRKALVVSDSPALRETVEIVLGDQFAVEAVSAASAPREAAAEIALIVVDSQAPVPLGDAPVISIGDSRIRAIAPGRRRQYLPEPFDALALREAAAMLARPAPAPARRATASFLSPPFLPAELQAAAARAVGSRLPVCLWGEAGSGKLRLARTLHSESGAAYLLVVASAELNRGPLRPPAEVSGDGEVTVVVNDLEALDAAGQSRLMDILESGRLGSAPARVIGLSCLDPTDLVRDGRLGRHLFYRLGVLVLPLPPLRQRGADIPALARAVAASLSESLGLPAVDFSEAALLRLSRYLWFGNLAEFEAVLARSIIFATGSRLDVADLRFGYGAAAPAPAMAAVRAAAPRAAAPAGEQGADAVDVIIQELAHEFRNPMVTIKTFAHQLDHMLSNGGGYEEFARLTGEAVERMDAALENLVQYTRFEQPARQPTPLGSIVSTALGGVQEYVGEKQLALDVEPTAAQVLVDPAQCGYAVKNLLRAVVRDLSTGDLLAVRARAPSGLAIEYPARARSAASSLARLVSGDDEGKDTLPLGFAFARSLIERNGGHLALDRDGDIARVTVEFPMVGESMVGDGKGEHGEA